MVSIFFFFLNTGVAILQTKDFIFLLILYLFSAVLGLHCCMDFSLVAAMGATLWLWRAGFSLWRLLSLQSTVSRRLGFSSCGSRALEHSLSGCGVYA